MSLNCGIHSWFLVLGSQLIDGVDAVTWLRPRPSDEWLSCRYYALQSCFIGKYDKELFLMNWNVLGRSLTERYSIDEWLLVACVLRFSV
jgi:hypothetical protein